MTTNTQAALRMALEEIAASWDGCEVDSVGETLDVGAQLRKQFATLLHPAIKESLTTAPVGVAEIGEELSASFIYITDAGRALPPGKHDLYAVPNEAETAIRALSSQPAQREGEQG